MKNVFKLLVIIIFAGSIFLFFSIGTLKAEGETSDFGASGGMQCSALLGPNLTKVVAAGISVVKVLGIALAVVNSAVALVPAVTDPSKIGAAKKKCVNMGIVLVIILLLPTILKTIGLIFNFDASCFLTIYL